ncbi:MAG: FG-GAP-like repeat-containing protein [Anaerolineales bacterium]
MRRFLLLSALLLLLTPAGGTQATLQPPTLEWQGGGCTHWCETGWYASPAVADLDGDGQPEVIGATYHVFALDGATGETIWRVDPPEPEEGKSGRAWPGVVVADLLGDGGTTIVTAHGGGYLHVWNTDGSIRWTRRPTSGELRSLAVYDLEGDGPLEIVVSAAIGSKTNTWVYDAAGNLRAGWPQLVGDSGYAYGIFNANVAVGDLDGDGQGEIVAPSDVHYICAYERDGSQIPANAIYEGKGWGQVGIWESLEVELRGWGRCNGERAESYRTNFAHGPAVIADMDGDGTNEVIATGNVYDCAVGHPPGKYNGVYVFHADRSRFQGSSSDWRTPPVDTGAPLSEDYSVIENNQPNPAVGDLDGDGQREIVYASYDGRVHAFWLDKTEHGSWPYSVYSAAEGVYRFASEPTLADLDDDGDLEVIFTSWPRKIAGLTGKLHILDHLGQPLQEVDLPVASGSWNGGLAAPTLANIDGDANLEVVINTAHTGIVAYELPGTADARIVWGTGRGNQQRSGSLLEGSLDPSRKEVAPLHPEPGDTITYTVTLANNGPLLPEARFTDTLPSEVTYAGNLWASSGQYGIAGDVITWTGEVEADTPVILSFEALVDAGLTEPHAVINTAWLDDGLGNVQPRRVTFIVNALQAYLPLILRE